VFETILVSDALPVITITINRPQKLKALNAQVIRELSEAFHALESAAPEARPRAVILTGAGANAFVAGADHAEKYGHTPAQT
jgi:enoyl-CoA hydratase